jgi:AcrR family transcriptional regulator
MKHAVKSPGPSVPPPDGRLAVLEAASRAFMIGGYGGTSIDEIADRLGSTKGRVYHYYRSKADIFLDIHRNVVSWMLLEIEVIASRPSEPDERLHSLAVRHVEMILERLPAARVALQSLGDYVGTNRRQHTVIAEVKGLRDRYEEVFTSTIEEGVAAGLLRPVNPQVAVKPLLGALNWTAMWFEPDEHGISVVQLADEVGTFVVEGLRAR